jgi:hypothetical protein
MFTLEGFCVQDSSTAVRGEEVKNKAIKAHPVKNGQTISETRISFNFLTQPPSYFMKKN